MTDNSNIEDNDIDIHVDEEIFLCLSPDKQESFFLFAGAGSGKTKSLVTALNRICTENGNALRLRGKRIGVITYTNAACDEIKHRLDFNPLVEVSTIHHFIWCLIEGFNYDIKEWMRVSLQNDLIDLKQQQLKGRAGKASIDRAKSIEEKTKRLTQLDTIKKFTYNPNGDNRGRASLNHSDVIQIGANFLTTKPLMQSILVAKFPILLIDESQDTNKHLMEAFLVVQNIKKGKFTLGLIGDTMQRIYADGKIDLGQNLPSDWKTPAKVMNHRSPERVVTLINKIRSGIDTQTQKHRADKPGGFTNIFIVNSNIDDKIAVELSIAKCMSLLTEDQLWKDSSKIKSLILEHHMAAKRMGFLAMYEPLYKSKGLRTGLLDGTLPGLRIFTKIILPIIQAHKKQNSFVIANIVKKNSKLLSSINLKNAGEHQVNQISNVAKLVDELLLLWDDDADPTFLSVLLNIAKSDLFEIPESLRPIVARTIAEQQIVAEEIKQTIDDKNIDDEEEVDEEEKKSSLDAWDEFLDTKFSQLESYVSYISDEAEFATHQGVKGLQFPRVMVIIDDSDARGFLFSYEKLFEVKAKTANDIQNENDNIDTSNNRTRRLLYVTCSRAEKSLAVVAYTNNPEKVQQYVLEQNWFLPEEVQIIDSI